MEVHYVSITFLLAFEWKCKVLKGLQVAKLKPEIQGQELDCYTLVAYSMNCTPMA